MNYSNIARLRDLMKKGLYGLEISVTNLLFREKRLY